jgi:replication factor C subunit 3/5
MDSDEETLLDVDLIPAAAKGKAKAIDRDRPFDNDNLPWCASSARGSDLV